VAAEEEVAAGVEARVHSYLLEAFASGTEGLMLKALDQKATYQASKRSESWLKLKRLE
jgi:ATP-dependent DNA ligase